MILSISTSLSSSISLSSSSTNVPWSISISLHEVTDLYDCVKKIKGCFQKIIPPQPLIENRGCKQETKLEEVWMKENSFVQPFSLDYMYNLWDDKCILYSEVLGQCSNLSVSVPNQSTVTLSAFF